MHADCWHLVGLHILYINIIWLHILFINIILANVLKGSNILFNSVIQNLNIENLKSLWKSKTQNAFHVIILCLVKFKSYISFLNCFCFSYSYPGFEGSSVQDERREKEERRERRSDVENSEDEWRRTRIGALKKKAINASTKFRHSLKKKRGRKVSAFSIKDVRVAQEQEACDSFRQILLNEDLLPVKHDDYHMMLRWIYFTINWAVVL